MFVDGGTCWWSYHILKISKKNLFKTFAVTQLWTNLHVGTLDLAGGDMDLNIANNIVKDVG